MKLSDFKIGERFRDGSRIWMCTDIGSRIVVATCLTVCGQNDYARALPERIQKKAWKLDPAEVDPAWLKGPPYAELGEDTFNERAQIKCEPYKATKRKNIEKGKRKVGG